MSRSRSLVRRIALRAGLSLLSPAVASSPLAAQLQVSVDLGAAGTDGAARTSSPVLFQGTLSWLTEHLRLEATALSAPDSPSPGGIYGLVQGEVRTAPVWRGWRLGADVLAGRGRRPTLFRETRLDLEGGPVLQRPGWEISSRYGVTQFDDFDRRLVRRVELFVRREFRLGYVTLGGRRVTFPDTFSTQFDTTYIVVGFPFRSSRRVFDFRDRSYIDAEAELARVIGPALVQLRGGTRFRSTGESSRPWGSVQVVTPIGRGIAIVAATGWTPSFPEQRRDQSWFASAGFRVLDLAALINPRSAARSSILSVVRTADGRRVLYLTGVQAQQVELRADFTDWEPIAMSRGTSGRWERGVLIAPGAHRVMMRVDGREWRAPPGLPVVPDEYGGEVGVLVVD
ncbi:MAG TPA: glycogen-binding domain-containing protein [Gemmatimonadaceae bacterium]|jgi:hypothetical protein|nr:glycogen-binding domain-containing protein [Gemmatimonadaceae bacterium]